MNAGSALTKPKVSIIVAALLPNFGIGNKGQLPWSLKQEMKYFRKLTTQTVDPTKRNAVIMGRKTYNSIPLKFRPLKGRLNIVLTRNSDQLKQELNEELAANNGNLQISGSLSHALDECESSKIEEIFIIGGAEVYNQLMQESHESIDRILLTEVHHDNNLEMDSFFNLDSKKWEKKVHADLLKYLESKGLHEEFNLTNNNENDFHYDFTLWEKK